MDANGIEGPSIAIFYENLGRIRRVEFWVFASPDSTEDHNRKVSFVGIGDPLFGPIVECLTYDYHTAALKLYGSVDDSAVIESLIGLNSDVSAVAQLGARMPTETFIEKHGTLGTRSSKKSCDSRYRSKLKHFVTGGIGVSHGINFQVDCCYALRRTAIGTHTNSPCFSPFCCMILSYSATL